MEGRVSVKNEKQMWRKREVEKREVLIISEGRQGGNNKMEKINDEESDKK